jgi:hypothetical protein
MLPTCHCIWEYTTYSRTTLDIVIAILEKFDEMTNYLAQKEEMLKLTSKVLGSNNVTDINFKQYPK